MSKTSIEWTERTWNPVRGCSRISPGCVNCYAERIAARFSGHPGNDGPFHSFAENSKSGPRWTGKVELIEHMLDIPLRTRKPTVWVVNSMSDLFHEALPDEAIDRIFTIMVAADWHTYQILTKRADRMREYFASGRHDNGNGPDRATYHLDQKIWIGVSVEDQQRADERIPLLLRTPAAVRFLSCEPLLGPLDLQYPKGVYPNGPQMCCNGLECCCMGRPTDPPLIYGIDWCIVGGESGPGARPMNLAWARSIVEQCKAARVPVFCKQLGARPVYRVDSDMGRELSAIRVPLRDKKGGDMHEWPHELRVREYPRAKA